jgi:hypothetical protein
VRVRVTAEGSLSDEQIDSVWTAGAGERVEVSGPDWAVLAWMVGRAATAGDALSAAPPLRPWL